MRYNHCSHPHLQHCHQACGVAFIISITVLIFIFHLILFLTAKSYLGISCYPSDLSCMSHHLQGDASPLLSGSLLQWAVLTSIFTLCCFCPRNESGRQKPPILIVDLLPVTANNHFHNICGGHGCAVAVCIVRYPSPQTANLSLREDASQPREHKKTAIPLLHLDTPWNMSRIGRVVLRRWGTPIWSKILAETKLSNRASAKQENKRARGSGTADIFTNQQAR